VAGNSGEDSALFESAGFIVPDVADLFKAD